MLRFMLAVACLTGCGDPAEPTSDAVAHVGAQAITAADLKHAGGGESTGEARLPAAVLDAVVDEARLAAAAREDGLADDPAIQAELAAAERRILARHYRTRALADALTGRALHDHFTARQGDLTVAEVRVRHVRVGLDPRLRRTDPDAARREAMNRARTLYARIEGGASFAALAAELADDPRVSVYAEPVSIRAGDVDPEFFERVRHLDRGALAAPFTTDFGAHVVQADRAAVMHRPALREVSGRLRAELQTEAEQALMRRLAERYPLRIAEPRPEETVR